MKKYEKQVRIRMDDETYQTVEKLCKFYGLCKSKIIRRLVKDGLIREHTKGTVKYRVLQEVN